MWISVRKPPDHWKAKEIHRTPRITMIIARSVTAAWRPSNCVSTPLHGAGPAFALEPEWLSTFRSWDAGRLPAQRCEETLKYGTPGRRSLRSH